MSEQNSYALLKAEIARDIEKGLARSEKDLAAAHSQDSDCTVDERTDCCRVCGVHHWEPCDLCDGRGFHVEGCAKSEAEDRGDRIDHVDPETDEYRPASISDLIEDETATNGMNSEVARDLRIIANEQETLRSLLRAAILDLDHAGQSAPVLAVVKRMRDGLAAVRS